MPNGKNVIAWAVELLRVLQKQQYDVDQVAPEALHLLYVRGYTVHQAAVRLLHIRAHGQNPTSENIPSMETANRVGQVQQEQPSTGDAAGLQK